MKQRSNRIKLSFVATFLVCAFSVNAQFGIVKDKEGRANARALPDSKSKIAGTLPNGELVFCFPEEKGWHEITSNRTRLPLPSYMHRSRIVFIDSFPVLKNISQTEKQIVFKRDSIQIIITTRKFESKKHFITTKDGFVERIDNKKFWGCDGNLPRIEYASISIINGQEKFTMPRTDFSDLYEPNFEFTSAHYDPTNQTIFLSAINSDGAGGYAVLWKIKNKKVVERFVLHPF